MAPVGIKARNEERLSNLEKGQEEIRERLDRIEAAFLRESSQLLSQLFRL